MNKAQCMLSQSKPSRKYRRCGRGCSRHAGAGVSPADAEGVCASRAGLVQGCGNRGPERIPVAEAHAYLGTLTGIGATRSVWSNACAGVRFLYEVTLGQAWRRFSPLRRRMLEDMDLRGFSPRRRPPMCAPLPI